MKVKIKFTGKKWDQDKKGKVFDAEIVSFVAAGITWQTGVEGWEIESAEYLNHSQEPMYSLTKQTEQPSLRDLLGQRIKTIEFMED